MKKSDLTDEAIIKAITDGHTRLGKIAIAMDLSPHGMNLLRVRLQAMRNAGLIECSGCHWRVIHK